MKTPSSIHANNWLERAISRFGERFDYSRVEYINSSTKVTIVCSEHGAFNQWPSDHLNSKHGCPKCGTEAGVQCCLERDPNHFSKAGRIGNQRDISLRYNAAIKTKQTRVGKGEWIEDSNLEPWENYKRQVTKLTRRTTRGMDLSGIGRSNNDFQVDHIVSKIEGFRAGVSPEELSHPANLRIIPTTQNRAKSGRSEMSISELRRKIIEHDFAERRLE